MAHRPWEYVDYENITNDLNCVIQRIKACYANTTDHYHLVGHSLGGIIALSLSNEPWVKSITTIATPLGGLDINPMQSIICRSSFLGEIASYSVLIQELSLRSYVPKVQHIHSISGFSPWTLEKSDGVINLSSQRRWSAGEIHEVSANHHEIMMMPKTALLLNSFMNQVEQS